MAGLVLVLGGVRSGKSRLAEELARGHDSVAYLATATAGDAEMQERIRRHRERRPAHWRTVECPWDLPAAVSEAGTRDCLLIECVPLWLTNLMLGLPGHSPLDDAAAAEQIDGLIQVIAASPARVLVVSNEVGWGIIPENALARRFGDRLGEANQRLAAAADEVHLCVAGLRWRLK
jgi:adenosylcobinamide kinase/adenosylcobinamide-phosphate guanylyltransferase